MPSTSKCCVQLDPTELRHPVVFQSPILGSDRKQTGNWKNEFNARAKIEPFAGREFLLSQQVSPRLSHRVTLRYRAGIGTDWRIKFRERILHIDRVINVEERNRVLELICIEKTQAVA